MTQSKPAAHGAIDAKGPLRGRLFSCAMLYLEYELEQILCDQ